MPIGTCSTCEKAKPLTDFYKTRSKRGYSYDCIACTTEAWHDRKRRDPDFRLKNALRQSKLRKSASPATILRLAARRIVYEALRAGIIERGQCRECGSAKTEAHHEDYTRPLDVVWLCRRHHKGLHAART